LRRESVRNMSDPFIGNDPRVIVYRKRTGLTVNDGLQNAWLRLQESLYATGAGRIKVCRMEFHNAY
jgi:hypothetical protein